MKKPQIRVLVAGVLIAGMSLAGAGGHAQTAGAAANVTASYKVSTQDTLYQIAVRHGFSLSRLISSNPQLANPNIIWPGMTIKLPAGNSKTGTTNTGTGTTTNTGTGTTTNTGTGTTNVSTSAYAQQVAVLVNQERAKAGLGALTVNAGLTKVAVDKAKDMYTNHYFDHNSPTYGSPFDMMKAYGVSYSYAGENIAMGQRNPQEVMKAWMNSPGHKANILNQHFTKIGVAYYNGEWVQEFTG